MEEVVVTCLILWLKISFIWCKKDAALTISSCVTHKIELILPLVSSKWLRPPPPTTIKNWKILRCNGTSPQINHTEGYVFYNQLQSNRAPDESDIIVGECDNWQM